MLLQRSRNIPTKKQIPYFTLAILTVSANSQFVFHRLEIIFLADGCFPFFDLLISEFNYLATRYAGHVVVMPLAKNIFVFALILTEQGLFNYSAVE